MFSAMMREVDDYLRSCSDLLVPAGAASLIADASAHWEGAKAAAEPLRGTPEHYALLLRAGRDSVSTVTTALADAETLQPRRTGVQGLIARLRERALARLVGFRVWR